MTSIRFLKFLLLLLLHRVYSEEAEPVLRAKGSNIEMGYCFGVDYIVVYRCAPDGDQLLGNSSADSMPITPPVDLQGRIRINDLQDLLGLQILNLTYKDSGIYRRECWQNRMLVSQHTQHLVVCNEEVESVEITVKEDGGAELLCKYTSIGSDGTSVRWYKEMYPSYKPTLFLDSSVSLDTELQGVVEVRDNGALLLLDNSTLKYNHQFVCLVSKGKSCLSFQSMHLPDRSESSNIFASQGDKVVLKCPSDGDNQQWHTPQGKINGSSEKMHISRGDRSEDFSLVIPAITDEHSGEYSCISSTLELHFRLALCPKKVLQEKVEVVEGGSVLLDCVKDDYEVVEWHRRKPSSDSEVIYASAEKTVPIPEDVRGRVTVSKNGSSLMISHVEVKDQAVYWCIVLGGAEFLEDYSSNDDYDEEDIGEDDFSDGVYWENPPRCIFKQETILKIIRDGILKTGLETGSTADPPAAHNVTTYAVAGGLVGLLVVGVIVAVIAVKRAKASPKQRAAASHSGLNTTKDVKMNMESECTQSLTHNNEQGV